MDDLVHDGSHMQQRLGRDADHVQADAAQAGVALHQNHFQAEIGGAEGGAVAAGASAQHQQVTFQISRAGKAGGCRHWPGGRSCYYLYSAL